MSIDVNLLKIVYLRRAVLDAIHYTIRVKA